MSNKGLLEVITKYYITSRDFNGLPMNSLQNFVMIDLEKLISDGFVEAVSFEDCLNPFIRAYEYNIKTEDQIQNVRIRKNSTVLFPTKKALTRIVTSTSKPYTAMLEKGEIQYKIIFFEPQIIELYSTNPQYINHFFGYRGLISVHEEHYNAEGGTNEYIENYGMAYKYGEKVDRAIGVFLRDISRLSDKQQKRWESYEVHDQTSCVVAQRFVRELVYGEWLDDIWIFDALLLEMETINVMCKAMDIPAMFKKFYSVDEDARPIGYTTILLPTKRNFYDFINVLEKLIINNLDSQTFTSEGFAIRHVNKFNDDGKEKGTLVLLSEWLYENTSPKDIINECIILPLKFIRKARQHPAHELDVDEYNLDYYTKQTDIIKTAYGAIAAIRLRLSKHPRCFNVVVPKPLQNPDNIKTY